MFNTVKNIYYVDYENIGSEPLLRLLRFLGREDKCIIFWSDHANKFDAETVMCMKGISASIEFQKADFGKNALDMQLVSHLLYFRKKNINYYIVSNDTGYDFAVGMCRRMGWNRLFRLNSTLQMISGKYKENQLTPKSPAHTFPETDSAPLFYFEGIKEAKKATVETRAACTEDKNKKIESILKKAKNRSRLHTLLTQEYGQQKGREIYYSVKERLPNA